MNSLTAPLVHSKVITPHGFKEVALIAGASDKIFAIDADTGKLMWKKTMAVEGASKQKPQWLCPNALNATPVIDRRARTVYVAASDGRLHAFNLVNGEDRFPPVQFFPAFAKPWSLNLVDDVLYTVTSQRCNGVKSGVYAMNLSNANRPVSYFEASSAGAGIWGRAGAAATLEGNIVIETGDGPYGPCCRQALRHHDRFLCRQGSEAGRLLHACQSRLDHEEGSRTWANMSPVVFTFKKWELAAGVGKEGVIYLVDRCEIHGWR